MSGKEEPAGWGLSSEQYDEDKVLEVDSRSADHKALREEAKDPHATWSHRSSEETSEEPDEEPEPEPPPDDEQ